MEQVSFITIAEMKEALTGIINSVSAVKITRKDGETIFCYVRGFADHQSNILLLSEKPHCVGLKILEVNHIHSVHYSHESNGSVTSRILQIKPVKKVLYFF